MTMSTGDSRGSFMTSDPQWMHQQFRIMASKHTLCDRVHHPGIIPAPGLVSDHPSGALNQTDANERMKAQFSKMAAKWKVMEPHANKPPSPPAMTSSFIDDAEC